MYKRNMLCTAAVVLAVLLLPPLRAAAADGGGLSPDLIESLKKSFERDPGNRPLLNAIAASDVQDLVYDRDMLARHDDLFNFRTEAKGITAQESTGRCWLFAGFNAMRPAVMKKYNLSEFEFSENHLFFWDKLEKANMFLEAMIETRGKDIDDREVQALLADPVPDGGWWSYVVGVIEKHGCVPKSVGPETRNSSDTGRMNRLLNTLARGQAAELRRLSREGAKLPELHRRKAEMLEEHYRILALHLGIPPEEFTWRYEDKDKKIHEGRYTPQGFYREAVEVNLRDYVSLYDHPGHDYDEHYMIKYCRNVWDLPDLDFINVKASVFKEWALAALLSGEPVWFAADIGKDNDREHGILRVGIYDYGALLGVDLGMSKAERILYRDSSANHAMVFVGADTVGARATKWLVENSWGTSRGNKGYWTMYDDWFDAYVYTVIVHKDHLPPGVLALLERKPKQLPAWDPMRSAIQLLDSQRAPDAPAAQEGADRGTGEGKVKLENLVISIVNENHECEHGFETEWGFSCIVDGAEKRILFDTGGKPEIFTANFERTGVDPASIGALVLSHEHGDHVGGMEAFLERRGGLPVYMCASFSDQIKERAGEHGARVVSVDEPLEICRGVHSTGEMEGPANEQALVIDTDRGAVVITGCAHPGIIEIVARAKEITGGDILFVMGGFHLLQHGGEQIDGIIARLRELGVEYAAPCHCSGDEAIEAFHEAYGARFVRIGAGMAIDASYF